MKKRRHIFGGLYFRFFGIYGITSSVLVILVGVVFFRLYSRNAIGSFREQLQADAREISHNINEYVIQDEYEGFLNYMDAIQALLESQKVDVWIMPYYKADNHLEYRYANTTIHYKNMSKGMKKVMKEVYKNGVSASNDGYDEIYEDEMIRAGAPILDAGGNVIGGVLLNAMTSGRREDINGTVKIIVYSLITAWIVSVLAALFLSRKLSNPITKIRKTAIRLAEGDYNVKTGIHKGGEIGELADTVDILSDRLSENEKIREEIEKGRMDFFANVSHELRTPITVMRGYTETLADGVVTDRDKIKYTLGRMLKECTGMERLVGDLLTLSKMENPDFELNKEPVSVVQVFDEVIRSARILGDEKEITIRFTHNDGYCFISGDYDRLRQLFLIIIDNAIKFSHEKSYIDISCERKENETEFGSVVINITDYGVGIDADMLPNIFDKFYRSKLRMNEKGSGLGLMIANQITKKHGGTIEVSSVPGEGSTFTLIFDAIQNPEE